MAEAEETARAAVKRYARIEEEAEDALLDALVQVAIEWGERVTGLAAIRGARTATVPADGAWHALPLAPVIAILAVEDAGGAALSAAGVALDIAADGSGRVRVGGALSGPGVRVRYLAGLAEAWAGLPAAWRQGVVRTVAHWHAHRDAPEDAGPPAAAVALWRSLRRVRL